MTKTKERIATFDCWSCGGSIATNAVGLHRCPPVKPNGMRVLDLPEDLRRVAEATAREICATLNPQFQITQAWWDDNE